MKIVATIGPASSGPERLEELFRAGADGGADEPAQFADGHDILRAFMQ